LFKTVAESFVDASIVVPTVSPNFAKNARRDSSYSFIAVILKMDISYQQC